MILLQFGEDDPIESCISPCETSNSSKSWLNCFTIRFGVVPDSTCLHWYSNKAMKTWPSCRHPSSWKSDFLPVAMLVGRVSFGRTPLRNCAFFWKNQVSLLGGSSNHSKIHHDMLPNSHHNSYSNTRNTEKPNQNKWLIFCWTPKRLDRGGWWVPKICEISWVSNMEGLWIPAWLKHFSIFCSNIGIGFIEGLILFRCFQQWFHV